MPPKCNQIQPDRVWGKAIKDKIALCAAGDTGQKGTFDSVLNLKYTYSGSEISVAHS
jgi:hypothetical protein